MNPVFIGVNLLREGGHEHSLPVIKVIKLTSWRELESLRIEWERILEKGAATIFSTPEWQGGWYKAFAKDKELCALAFLNPDNEVVGLAPLYTDWLETPLRLRLRRLRFVGDGSEDSDNLDLIIRPGWEAPCVKMLLAWLAAQSEWDLCELNTLPLSSISLALLLLHLRTPGWTCLELKRACSAISLPETWEGYLNQISKKEKRKIHSFQTRIENNYAVAFHKCTNEQEIPACLEILFELHQKRWNLKGGPGTFSSPHRREFYREIAVSFLKRGWLGFWILRLNGKPVAAQFGFRYRETFYGLQEGFDPSYSADRVGYLLRAHVVKSLIAEGVRRYDFLAGKDPYKKRWGAEMGNYLDVHFARSFTKGGLYLGTSKLGHRMKEGVRSVLPASTLALLRQIRYWFSVETAVDTATGMGNQH